MAAWNLSVNSASDLESGTATDQKKLILPNAGPVGRLVTDFQPTVHPSIKQTQTAVPVCLIALC
jgi:hypothetical protein